MKRGENRERKGGSCLLVSADKYLGVLLHRDRVGRGEAGRESQWEQKIGPRGGGRMVEVTARRRQRAKSPKQARQAREEAPQPTAHSQGTLDAEIRYFINQLILVFFLNKYIKIIITSIFSQNKFHIYSIDKYIRVNRKNLKFDLFFNVNF